MITTQTLAEMVTEFGFVKTANAIQYAYDNDAIDKVEADAMIAQLESMNQERGLTYMHCNFTVPTIR